MPRARTHAPLRVIINENLVGVLTKEVSGAVQFSYAPEWLAGQHSFPVSLSLPLREDAYRGQPVSAVFENLLPDSDTIRRRVAERVGAEGTDAYSLLTRIGRDCVGALQFLPDADGEVPARDTSRIEGDTLTDEEIGAMLRNLAQAPLGLDRDQPFRISIAGAQEKTALLYHEGKWMRPRGVTPTTHILKTKIGSLPNGVDLSDSIENEFYCLKLMAAFGLPVNEARIEHFDGTKALVIERFDRKLASNGRLLRLPQEDCCQALSIPPVRKYQNEGGPGMVDILRLLKVGDIPEVDQMAFLKAQILFWLMGATDGHAKNFSIFLGPGGVFRLTPFYDVLTAQPSLDTRQIERKQFTMAMSVGDNRHYKIERIEGRHFVQTAQRAGLPVHMGKIALEQIAGQADEAFNSLENLLPRSFPEKLHASVRAAFLDRLKKI